MLVFNYQSKKLNMQNIHTKKGIFYLESGRSLQDLTIGYQTYGQLNNEKNNVVWVTHALTGSTDVHNWWKGLFGENKTLDPEKYFIVCANVLGSCYGSTGPLEIDPETGTPYFHFFPEITVRDMVKAHEVLRKTLGISSIHLLIGGSLGGQQALEWAVQQPKLIKNLCVLATNAQHSPWGIAFNSTQRMAIENDPTWQLPIAEAGSQGLATARAIAMLSYRHYNTYENTQKDNSQSISKHLRAESYQRYQGEKLRKRFNAFSYWHLSKAMDTHNLGRGRENIEGALKKIQAKTLCIGISTDILFPPQEQKLIAEHIRNAEYKEIHSDYGHDGFLVETDQINESVLQFLKVSEKRKTTTLSY